MAMSGSVAHLSPRATVLRRSGRNGSMDFRNFAVSDEAAYW